MFCTQLALAETMSFSIDATASTFEYGPPTGGPGVPGCGPLGFGRCVFDLLGTFDFAVASDSLSAEFVNIDVSLSGHELSEDPFITSRLASLLESLAFQSEGDGKFHAIGTIEVQLTLTRLLLSGGFDRQPGDGDLVVLNVTALLVPEPEVCRVVLAVWFLLLCRRAKRAQGCCLQMC